MEQDPVAELQQLDQELHQLAALEDIHIPFVLSTETVGVDSEPRRQRNPHQEPQCETSQLQSASVQASSVSSVRAIIEQLTSSSPSAASSKATAVDEPVQPAAGWTLEFEQSGLSGSAGRSGQVLKSFAGNAASAATATGLDELQDLLHKLDPKPSTGNQENSHVSGSHNAPTAVGNPQTAEVAAAAFAAGCGCRHAADQQAVVQQLLQQHGKLLDLLQIMALSVKASTGASDHKLSAGQHNLLSTADPGDAVETNPAPYSALQEQYQQQMADHHQQRKRFVKVQKLMLQQLQDAKLQAVAAQAARDEAFRREHEAQSAVAALQAELTQQQQDLATQQQEIALMRDQLLLVKQLHVKKVQQVRQTLQQQYEAHLQALAGASASYSSPVQGRQQDAARPTTAAASNRAGNSSNSSRRPGRLGHGRGAGGAAVAGSNKTSRLPSNGRNGQCADMQRRGSKPKTAVGGKAVRAIGKAAAADAAPAKQQQRQQESDSGAEWQHAAVQQADAVTATGLQSILAAMQARRAYKGATERQAAAEAAPNLHKELSGDLPVPEAAAQLAQHFVAGGEGISRPLSAPSSDRLGLIPVHGVWIAAPPGHSRGPAAAVQA